MGWDYTMHKAQPGEITKEFMHTWQAGQHTMSITDAAWANYRHLWGILREDGRPKYIVLWLVDFRKDSWGYKSISEEMGPYYYDCPNTILEKCPCPDNEEARSWRAAVGNYHAKRSRNWAVGDRVRLIGRRIGMDSSPEVTITSIRPLRCNYYGYPYRLTKSSLAEAERI